MRRGYVDTPLGQLHYAEAGTGPALLLLHQTPRSHDEFREVQPLLATGRRVIAMDLPGFGLSAPLPAPQSIERFAAGAVALLDALGIAETAVLGHHTGAVVGIELAASVPSRVRALVLSSAPWTGPQYRARHAGGPAVDVATPAPDGSHLAELWRQRAPYYPPGRTDLLDRFIHDALSPGVDPAEGHRACARYRMEERIGRVTAPVLLLGAGGDPFALPDLPVFRANLAHARSVDTHVVDGGTIPLMEQCPSEIAAVVNAFLNP